MPSFVKKYEIIVDEKTTKFKHVYVNNHRKLFLLAKPRKVLQINNKITEKFNGIIINPVCNEITLNEANRPLAVDIQGFIRNCKEGEEIEYTKLILPPLSSYFIFHANIEEYEKSELSTNMLLQLGFKEILLSYDENGFEIYTEGSNYYFKTRNKGAYSTGTGDVLLASYFYYRLNGFSLKEAGEKALEFVEWFSNFGYQELFRIM